MSKTKKQKFLYSVMAIAITGMVVNMGYSYFANSKKATQREMAKQKQVWALKQATQPPLIPTVAPHSQSAPLIKETPRKNRSTPTASLALSDDAKDSLNALKNAYLSEVKTTEHKAKIAEIKANQQLNALQHPAPVKKKAIISPPKKPAYVPIHPTVSVSLLDAVNVKSIFFNDKRVVAWLSFDGQLVPVKKGAHILGAIVTDITKSSVIFNDNGHKVTRYKMPPQSKVKDNKKTHKDMT